MLDGSWQQSKGRNPVQRGRAFGASLPGFAATLVVDDLLVRA